MARNSLTPTGSGLSGNDPFLSFQRGMNKLFGDVFYGMGMPLAGAEGQEAGMIMPSMNVSETDNELRITAELPGVSEKDVDVTLDDDVLTIRGEKKFEKEEGKEGENYHFVERSFGRFQRSLRIPHSVKSDQVQARVENGILTVILPKNKDQEKARHIRIQGSSH